MPPIPFPMNRIVKNKCGLITSDKCLVIVRVVADDRLRRGMMPYGVGVLFVMVLTIFLYVSLKSALT
jgi:hypothetical protein